MYVWVQELVCVDFGVAMWFFCGFWVDVEGMFGFLLHVVGGLLALEW